MITSSIVFTNRCVKCLPLKQYQQLQLLKRETFLACQLNEAYVDQGDQLEWQICPRQKG